MLWYAREVLPHVRERCPASRRTSIGSRRAGVDQGARRGRFRRARVTCPTSTPYFAGCRVSIAPLRYGAGVKGKVNLAMSHGLPVVATTVVDRRHAPDDGDDVLVADDPRAFADAVRRAYEDEALWERLSAGGRREHRAPFLARRRARALRGARRLQHVDADRVGGIAASTRDSGVNSRSNTAWPRAMPRCSNFVSGRHAGRGAKSVAGVDAAAARRASTARISSA